MKKLISPGRPRKLTLTKFRNLAHNYFTSCDKRTKLFVTKKGDSFYIPNPEPYTIAAFCVACNLTRSNFYQYLNDNDNPLHDFTQRCYEKICANREVGGLDGSQNATFARFLMVNQDKEHFSEEQRVELTAESSLLDILTQKKDFEVKQ